MTIGFSISTSGSSGNNSGSGQATAGTPESQGSVGAAGLVLQQHSWADCMDNLKAAAQESLRRIQLVSASSRLSYGATGALNFWTTQANRAGL